MILEQELRELFGKMGLGQAEQQHIHSIHMYRCLFVDLTGARLSSVYIFLTVSLKKGRTDRAGATLIFP